MDPPEEGASVLANLPRTRPQRATARRAAARRSDELEAAHKTNMLDVPVGEAPAAKPAKPAKPRAKAAKTAKRAPAGARTRAAEPVPRQGYESEDDLARGPVSPPGGIELVASAAELLGELAKAGVGTGERLVRDLLSRLPGT